MTHEGVDAMGRGRAKAKQTKVARELKYYAPETNLDALQRELHGAPPADVRTSGKPAPDGEDDEDEYARWASGSHG
jgi:Protein of unknown function (DUF3073)